MNDEKLKHEFEIWWNTLSQEQKEDIAFELCQKEIAKNCLSPIQIMGTKK